MRCTAKNAKNVFFLSLMENETCDSQGLKREIQAINNKLSVLFSMRKREYRIPNEKYMCTTWAIFSGRRRARAVRTRCNTAKAAGLHGSAAFPVELRFTNGKFGGLALEGRQSGILGAPSGAKELRQGQASNASAPSRRRLAEAGRPC